MAKAAGIQKVGQNCIPLSSFQSCRSNPMNDKSVIKYFAHNLIYSVLKNKHAKHAMRVDGKPLVSIHRIEDFFGGEHFI